MNEALQERPVFAAAQSLEQARKGSRSRSVLRWGLRSLGLCLLLFGGFVAWVWTTCFATPPELEGSPAILAQELRVTPEGRKHFGSSWFEEQHGRSLLYLEGDPYSLGYANARLTSDWIYGQEKSLIDTVRGFLPGEFEFWGITLLVLTNNRSLPTYVSHEYQLEIRGLADGSEDPFPRYGPRYHRLLNYHAAHDISHWVWDKPVVGCTAFAVRGAWTPSHDLIVGRNFDFEAGRLFDEHKTIGLYRPETGLAFLSVAWPGMSGAVTGINAERIYCSVNGAHSDDRGRIGTPVSLVVRQVLQYATSIDEAVDMITHAQVFVADSYMLADGETGEAVVVEKTPARTAVRSIADGILLQANHFMTDELASDPGNLEYMRIGTSVARFARLEELTRAARGQIDPARAAKILRDREAPGGKPLCDGNRGAINAMIATHSVIANVSTGELWVSRGPHQLGEYDSYSIMTFGEAGTSLPADPSLADGSYERLTAARKLLSTARELADDPNMDRGRVVLLAREALALVPGDPDVWRLLGEAYEAQGERKLAHEAYAAALDNAPPFEPDRAALQAAILRLYSPGAALGSNANE